MKLPFIIIETSFLSFVLLWWMNCMPKVTVMMMMI